VHQRAFEDSEAEFRSYLGKGELRMQKCTNCGHVRYPTRWICPECLETDWTFYELSGRGTIETFVWYCEPVDPASPEVPYNVAIVALEGGPRVITNILRVNFGDLKVGQNVVAVFSERRGEKPILCFEVLKM
jgi:uncharacterized OB-fold protein